MERPLGPFFLSFLSFLYIDKNRAIVLRKSQKAKVSSAKVSEIINVLIIFDIQAYILGYPVAPFLELPIIKTMEDYRQRLFPKSLVST